MVASFEGALPKRIKQLPLDNLFELSSIKKVSGCLVLMFRYFLLVFAFVFLG